MNAKYLKKKKLFLHNVHLGLETLALETDDSGRFVTYMHIFVRIRRFWLTLDPTGFLMLSVFRFLRK